ncbi:MAG: glycoside hydrolase family 32 protein [Bacteroidales bacterium]|nr:glycoside hydrolase family 32 protein [Bacteroidales bacterium]
MNFRMNGWSLLLIGLVLIANGCKQPNGDENKDAKQENGTVLYIDTADVSSDYYTEQHRPQFHFTPEEKWMNDPNGMVYYDGEYHLFYQHNPDTNVWGPMHWGHAVSTDLVHWGHLPIALYPDELGTIFSGSAVVDEKNTTGFKKGEEDPIVAMFTHHHDQKGQTQSIAYSLNRGRDFTKYKDNPVITNPGIADFRDPKVLWHEESRQWVMVLAVRDHVRIYKSPDLINWEMTSKFGKGEGNHNGVWECPDLFQLPVGGNPEDKRWVMIVSIGDGAPNGGSGTQYFIGDFDGEKFTNVNPAGTELWIDWGRDNYAGVTWANIPEKDGRRIFLGWMSNWRYATMVPTYKWRSAMTVPRKLELYSTPEGICLSSEPVDELTKLRMETTSLEAEMISGYENKTGGLGFSSPTMEMELEFTTENGSQFGNASHFGIELSNSKDEKVSIGYEKDNKRFFIDRRNSGKTDFSEDFAGIHYAPWENDDEKIKMKLLIDVSSVELFAEDGKVVMTDIFFPNEEFTQVKLFSKNGNVKLNSGKIWNLKSAWNPGEK